MSLLYLDTCCIIYLIEASSPFNASVSQRLRQHSAIPNAALISSRLARLECRTKPLRNADHALLLRYDHFFALQRFRLIEISDAVIEQATGLRAKYGFKTPDALHLATAILEKADVFLTADRNLEKCLELRVELIV